MHMLKTALNVFDMPHTVSVTWICTSRSMCMPDHHGAREHRSVSACAQHWPSADQHWPHCSIARWRLR